MRAHILSIGSELIRGDITDTNATYLAQELAGLGIELLHVTQVGDDRPRLVNTLRNAVSDAELVICTGGVGPTDDDLTREGIAEMVGETPKIDPATLAELEAFFAARGVTMPERNKKQAWLIPSAETLSNPVGTAPGWFVRYQDRVIICMPGVPREMFKMWREQAAPRIEKLLPDRFIRGITFRTIGIGESAAEQMLVDLVQISNPSVATYAKDDGVHIRVTGVSNVAADAEALRDSAADEVEKRLAAYIYSKNETALPVALIELLNDRGLTIAIADQGAGGRFASLLLGEPVADGVLLGATLTSSGDSSAEALANEVRAATGASVGMGIRTEIAPVGTNYEGVVEIAVTGAISAVERFPMKSAFQEVQRRSALSASDFLRRALIS